jgi:hypothetical protein
MAKGFASSAPIPGSAQWTRSSERARSAFAGCCDEESPHKAGRRLSSTGEPGGVAVQVRPKVAGRAQEAVAQMRALGFRVELRRGDLLVFTIEHTVIDDRAAETLERVVRDRMNRAPRGKWRRGPLRSPYHLNAGARFGGLRGAYLPTPSGKVLLGSAGVADDLLNRVSGGRAKSSSAMSANRPTGFASVWPTSQSGTRGLHPAALTGAEP